MQVSVETTSGLTRKMTIAVPTAQFEDRVADRLKSAAVKVSIPGFRRGKVPLKELERRFGASVRREVASEVVQSSLEDAVRQENLPLIGTPSVELVNIDAGADLEFTATFEVLPEIELVDLATLKIRKPDAEIRDADIEDMVESLRKQRTQWNPVERPAAAKDRVVVDYAFKVDGQVVDGGEREDFAFVVGARETVEELDRAVVGMSVGETRAFPVTIRGDDAEQPDDGDAIGEVVVKGVEAPFLPDLDWAFFESFGIVGHDHPSEGEEDEGEGEAQGEEDEGEAQGEGDEGEGDEGEGEAQGEEAQGEEDEGEGDEGEGEAQGEDPLATGLDQFRGSVRERMAADLATAVRNETTRQVMKVLAHAHRFEVPRVLMAEELEQERRRMAQAMGIAADHAQLGEWAEKRVAERVRTRLVVREIVNKESLAADDDRIRAKVDEIASPYEESDDVKNWIYGDEEQLRRIELGVLEDRLVDHVLSLATVELVPSSYKDVVTGTSIPPLPEEEESAASPPEGTDAANEPSATGQSDRVRAESAGGSAASEKAGAPKWCRWLRRLFGFDKT